MTGCTAVLDFVNEVLTGYGSSDAAMKRILATSTLYVAPRLCPDGSELFLTTPYTCRSTPRLWPEVPAALGYKQFDVDGDGEITMMRIKDAGGNYKVSPADPRVMLPRLPSFESDIRLTSLTMADAGEMEVVPFHLTFGMRSAS